MKHIKKFNESYNKELQKIEDTLLEFDDAGYFEKYKIFDDKTRYVIIFRLNRDFDVQKTMVVMDNITSSLRKRFGNIYLYAGEIYIDKTTEKNREYLNKPISIYINEYLLNKFKRLKSYRAPGSFPDMLWYGQSPTEVGILFKYNKRQKILFLYNNRFLDLRNYVPSYEYILELIKDYVIKQLGLKVDTIDEAEYILQDFVPKHLIKLGPTEEFGLPYNGLKPKI